MVSVVMVVSGVFCESEVLLDYQLEIIGGFVVERILVEWGVNEFVILK
jgi:hypothetical protein